MPATILHESLGLTIKKNEKNGFCIATLHHTADPAKRSPEWRKEAVSGMTQERAAKEYDIDYTALMGSKVFPEITTRKGQIVIPGNHTFNPHAKYWGGFDYGSRNPSSFHVYTIDEGIVYSVWELFEPAPNLSEFALKMKACPYWPYIRYIAADPNIWFKTDQQVTGNLTSKYEILWRNGINKLIKGLQDEETWIAMMKAHWAQDQEPTFKIYSSCVNQIREFEAAIYVNQSESQLQTQSFKETISDHDNHSLDDCKYFLLSKPNPRQEQSAWKDPIMVKRWSQTRNTPRTDGWHRRKNYY